MLMQLLMPCPFRRDHNSVTKNSRDTTETIPSGCQIHCGQLISLFLSTNAGQRRYLSPALWHNLSIV